ERWGSIVTERAKEKRQRVAEAKVTFLADQKSPALCDPAVNIYCRTGSKKKRNKSVRRYGIIATFAHWKKLITTCQKTN
ncbi:hypothetical protein, partial [uncultured Muribaculum sp.]|uniref:hypothetical protein n=1 Tax=uncultured Muribaculum sp. TaxID=1918613 RepID=UPI0025B76584